MRRLVPIVALLAAALSLDAAPAAARLLPAVVLEGPNSNVRELGGVAMADDGTGGAVFLRRNDADGRVHVYASRFDGEHWSSPRRVDVDQPDLPQSFDSSWARIGAARDGRLVVTWIHPYARDPETEQRYDALLSAVLPRGSDRFLAPTVIDFDVGDSTRGAYPSLAMNSTGQALLSYRVVTELGGTFGSSVPDGYVVALTRVARFNGSRWSVLGNSANRNTEAFARKPTAGNSPKVTIDPQGEGAIAFQEPDDVLQVDRVWVRRIFGTRRFGNTLMASPSSFGGRSLNGDADSFEISTAPYGRVVVAWRQQPGNRSPLAGTRLMTNTLPTLFDEAAGAFAGAVLADGAGDGAPSAPGELLSVDAGPREGFALAYSSGERAVLTSGDEEGQTRATAVGAGATPPDPLVALGGEGERAVLAWRSAAGGGRVEIQQREDDAVRASGTLGAGAGEVNSLDLAESGYGDAIIAAHQGETEAGSIAVRVVDAPPDSFALRLSTGWVRKPRLRWEAAIDALGVVEYRARVGKRTVGRTKRRHLLLRKRQITDGVHRVVVTAIDEVGQETASRAGRLRLDRRAPRAKLRRGGRTVVLEALDGAKRKVSGPAGSRNVIRWGDGERKRGSARRLLRHTYERPGRYRIVAKLRDRAGNVAVRRLRVRIPG